MSNYIHPIDIEAAVEGASNLLPADKREIMEGHGLDPLPYLVFEAAKETVFASKRLAAGLPEWPELRQEV